MYIQVYMDIHTALYTCICTYNPHVYTDIHICMRAYMRAYVHVRIYVAVSLGTPSTGTLSTEPRSRHTCQVGVPTETLQAEEPATGPARYGYPLNGGFCFHHRPGISRGDSRSCQKRQSCIVACICSFVSTFHCPCPH